jgi:hypothetical protein
MPTFTKIASTTLASSAGSVTFSSIPQTFTDLCIKTMTRSTAAAVSVGYVYSINGTGGSGTYVSAGLRATGSSPTTVVNSNVFGWHSDFANGGGMVANSFSVHEVYIQNYVDSLGLNRTFGVVGGQMNQTTPRYIGVQTAKYQGTTAITSIVFQPDAGSWDIGSSFDLYGISNA